MEQPAVRRVAECLSIRRQLSTPRQSAEQWRIRKCQSECRQP